MARTHLLPACQSWLLEKVVFVLKMSPLVVDLEPRFHVLCQGAVAHHEHLAERKLKARYERGGGNFEKKVPFGHLWHSSAGEKLCGRPKHRAPFGGKRESRIF